MNTRFIGLDLAWSARNTTGAVVLEAESDSAHCIRYCDQLGDDQDVVSFLRQVAGTGPAIVAIDAPLVVPNEEGSRPVDRLITRVFGSFEAGCYPANRKLLGGCVRGEQIVATLAADGMLQKPCLRKQSPARTVFEVYPHPAMLALFRLRKTLKYKYRARHPAGLRRSEMARLQGYLANLQQGRPAMLLPNQITSQDLHTLRGRSLKRYEDLLDAAVCAYIAYYAWYWGPAGYQVYGDKAHGHILVPMTNWMRQLLAEDKRGLTNPSKPAIL